MREFDVVVVGAGPAAAAALKALPANCDAAVVTGCVPDRISSSKVHPKILTVATSGGVSPALAEAISLDVDRAIYSAASVGGLANYWGQQLVRYSDGDPWPREVFDTYANYESHCKVIESSLPMVGGKILRDQDSFEGYELRSPTLVSRVGASSDQDGLMAQFFRLNSERTSCVVLNRRAERILPSQHKCEIALDDGHVIASRTVILAAGTLGSANIVARSFSDITGYTFDDHTPKMLYAVDMRRVLKTPSETSRHFNVSSIQRVKNGRTDLFASAYDLRCTEINLLTATLLGRTGKWLRGMRMPPPFGLIVPLQVWTTSTRGRAWVDSARQTAQTLDAPRGQDEVLEEFIGMLRRRRVFVFRGSSTEVGDGFHHHNVVFSTNEGKQIEAGRLVEERTAGTVFSVDGMSMRTIGTKPPTLSVMALALKRTRDIASVAT